MPILNFRGKTFVQNHHLAVKYHQSLFKIGSERNLTGFSRKNWENGTLTKRNGHKNGHVKCSRSGFMWKFQQ